MDPSAKSTFTITRGMEQCIFLYPMNHWTKMEEEIAELNMYSGDARGFVRRIMMWADEVTLDGQGRITIPKPLMKFGDIDGSALILGAFDRIEIWNPNIFNAYLNGQSDDYESLAERVMGGDM